MAPIPADLANLPHTDAINQEFFLRGILSTESNAYAAQDMGLTLPALRSYCAGDHAKFGWSWQTNQSNGSVQAYPEVKCGRKPWTAPGGSTTPLLPKQIKDFQTLTVDLAYRYDASGSGNAAFDIWLLSSKDGGPTSIVGEVMIWLDRRGNQQPAGNFDSGNAVWDLYIKPGSGGNPAWPYYAFVHKNPTPGGILDLKEIVDYLVTRGLITDNLWLASVEFGNEFIDGDGWCAVDRFEVTIA